MCTGIFTAITWCDWLSKDSVEVGTHLAELVSVFGNAASAAISHWYG